MSASIVNVVYEALYLIFPRACGRKERTCHNERLRKESRLRRGYKINAAHRFSFKEGEEGSRLVDVYLSLT